MRRLVDLCLKRPSSTLAVAGVLTLVSLALLFRLRPQTSLVAMFDPNNPSVVALETVVNEFPVAEELLVFASLPEGAPDDRTALTGFADRLRDRLSAEDAKPLVANVRDRAGPEFRQFVEEQVVPHGLAYLDAAGRAEALRRLTPEGMAEQLERTKTALSAPSPAAGALGRTLARDPLRLFELLQQRLADSRLPGGSFESGDDRFLSRDRRGILLRIDGVEPPGDLGFSQRLVSLVEDAIVDVNSDGLIVQTAGAYAVAAYDTGEIQRDSTIGTFTSIGGLALVVGLLYRRPLRLFLFAFTPVAVGILWGFGVYALGSATLTPLAAVVGGALGGIGIDYPIHFLAHYDAERRKAADAVEAARATLARLGRPTFVAWLTSVIGFAAVALSPVGVLRDFALIGSLGLLGAGLATVTLLPAALVAFDRGGTGRPAVPRFDLGRRLAGLLLGPTRGVLVATLTFAVAAGGFVLVRGGALSLEYDLFALHPAPNPPLEAQREIQERMGLAGGTMFVLIEADAAEPLVAKAHEVARRLRSDAARAGGVVGSFGLDTLLPDPSNPPPQIDAEATVARLDAALADAGFRPEAFSEYATFLRLLASERRLPSVGDLLKYRDIASLVLPRAALDDQTARRSVSVIHFETELLDRDSREAALAGVRQSLAGMEGVVATGAPALGSDIEAAVLRDLPREFGLAIGLIGLTLALYFRSIGQALLALSPTLVSGVLLLLAMELFGLRLNLINGVMVPLLLGINVDYGIFAVVAARAGGQASDAHERLRAACGALVTCALTTSVGCGTLALTSVPAVQSLGILIVVGVLGCMVGTLGVTLPALLWWRASRAAAPA